MHVRELLGRRCGRLILASILVSGCLTAAAASPGDQVADVKAFHRAGQTFVTFDEIQVNRAGSVRYRIYRASHPIDDVSQLTPLATVSQASSLNIRASNPRVEGRRVQLRIEEGRDIPEGRGLFVYTSPESGRAYYAVTAEVDGTENQQISPNNNLAEAVEESVSLPRPILQGTTRASDGLLARRYVHFVNANSTPLLPAMSNTSDTRHIHFNFLVRNARASTSIHQPVVLGFHGGNGIFTEALQPSGNAEEILVGFDDPPPHTGYPPAVNTLWFGFAPNLGSGEPSQAGIVEPYTLRRIRFVVQWLKQEFPIDRNRIYCAGTSFGAIGSLMYGLHFPGEVAAMWLNLPRYDFRADGSELIPSSGDASTAKVPAWDIERGGGETSISRRFEPLFGSARQNLPTPKETIREYQSAGDGLGVYHRVNFRKMVELLSETDLPMLLLYHGKVDNVTGWHEKPLMVKALETALQPFQFYFLWGGHLFMPPTSFFEQAHSRARLHQYKRNQPLLAFSNASNNDELGDGLDMVRCARAAAGKVLDLGLTAPFVERCIESPLGLVSGDRQGTVNGYLDWNRNDVVDLPDHFDASVFVHPAASGNEATADITIRRLQNLRHAPGQHYRFENLDLAGGHPLQEARFVQADQAGRLRIPSVRLQKSGSRLRLETVQPDSQ